MWEQLKKYREIARLALLQEKASKNSKIKGMNEQEKEFLPAVQEVTEMVGYNDIPTFRKHFVDAFGTTPSTYANSTDNS